MNGHLPKLLIYESSICDIGRQLKLQSSPLLLKPSLMEMASVKVTRPLLRNTAVVPQINYIYRTSFPHQSPLRLAVLSRETGIATARSTLARQRRLTEQLH